MFSMTDRRLTASSLSGHFVHVEHVLRLYEFAESKVPDLQLVIFSKQYISVGKQHNIKGAAKHQNRLLCNFSMLDSERNSRAMGAQRFNRHSQSPRIWESLAVQSRGGRNFQDFRSVNGQLLDSDGVLLHWKLGEPFPSICLKSRQEYSLCKGTILQELMTYMELKLVSDLT